MMLGAPLAPVMFAQSARAHVSCGMYTVGPTMMRVPGLPLALNPSGPETAVSNTKSSYCRVSVCKCGLWRVGITHRISHHRGPRGTAHGLSSTGCTAVP